MRTRTRSGSGPFTCFCCDVDGRLGVIATSTTLEPRILLASGRLLTIRNQPLISEISGFHVG
jgi:hypothetical protein